MLSGGLEPSQKYKIKISCQWNILIIMNPSQSIRLWWECNPSSLIEQKLKIFSQDGNGLSINYLVNFEVPSPFPPSTWQLLANYLVIVIYFSLIIFKENLYCLKFNITNNTNNERSKGKSSKFFSVALDKLVRKPHWG